MSMEANGAVRKDLRLEAAVHLLRELPARQGLSKAILEVFAGKIAVVSSFGAESAVLLSLVAEIDTTTPILFIDTGKHFPETLAYRESLQSHLGLRNIIDVVPDREDLAAKDPEGSRYGYDPDGCCDLRKTIPLNKALKNYDAWISGRKRFHGGDRSEIPRAEIDQGRVKLNPLADWTPADMAEAFQQNDLPRHPLWRRGYLSIGCATCTKPAQPGKGPRSGRWSELEKTECGIHTAPIKAA